MKKKKRTQKKNRHEQFVFDITTNCLVWRARGRRLRSPQILLSSMQNLLSWNKQDVHGAPAENEEDDGTDNQHVAHLSMFADSPHDNASVNILRIHVLADDADALHFVSS
mmetsp:Transcript_16557/g.26240  ORF Transcript_16557/g.26240 Transcript_16557/m.26240 type:complete len:110 (-) Transcript_16557:333-662(-)